MNNKINIKGLWVEELEKFIVDNGYPKFRAKQVFEWVYKDVETFEQMKNLPKPLIELLNEKYYISRAKILSKQCSKSTNTTKYLFEFEDGNTVECVLMEYNHGKTACISTQVGCKMACTFCASAIGGLVRNLTCGEMLEEIMAIKRDVGERISNIVLMGVGEPFDNYKDVMKFLKMANNSKVLNIGSRHITVSTSGIIPRIIDFAKEQLQCNLAISLHAVDDETRNKIMPLNKKYPLEGLMEACIYYVSKTNRRITYEYALIDGVNDSCSDATRLAKMLKGQLCHINLISVNKVEGSNIIKASRENVQEFKKVLEKHKLEVTVRRELGSDIEAACGQLRNRVKN